MRRVPGALKSVPEETGVSLAPGLSLRRMKPSVARPLPCRVPGARASTVPVDKGGATCPVTSGFLSVQKRHSSEVARLELRHQSGESELRVET